MSDGRRLRVLCVVHDFTRECLALVTAMSLSGALVARELDAIVARRGLPASVVSNNGTELTSGRSCVGRRRPLDGGWSMDWRGS